MDCLGGHPSFLQYVRPTDMSVLILDENHLSENGIRIPNPHAFFKNLSSKTGVTLILRPYEMAYHVCPVRKAVPYLKSAEFPPHHWVGERRFPKGHTLIGGINPSPFMLKIINLLTEYSFAIKGVFLWADLVTQAYGPLPLGWVLIWHDHTLMICQDGVLRTSRSCHLSFTEELPVILRYLKRFGYQEGTPIILIKEIPFTELLPSFVHQEMRAPTNFIPKGFTLNIPELTTFCRLYAWPRWIKKIAYALTTLNVLGICYFTWDAQNLLETRHILEKSLDELPTGARMDPEKMEAFASYRELSKGGPSPLNLLRQFARIMKGELIVTHLYWTADPGGLILHLEFNPYLSDGEFLSTVQTHFSEYEVTWQPEDEKAIRGTLTLKNRAQP